MYDIDKMENEIENYYQIVKTATNELHALSKNTLNLNDYQISLRKGKNSLS